MLYNALIWFGICQGIKGCKSISALSSPLLNIGLDYTSTQSVITILSYSLVKKTLDIVLGFDLLPQPLIIETLFYKEGNFVYHWDDIVSVHCFIPKDP